MDGIVPRVSQESVPRSTAVSKITMYHQATISKNQSDQFVDMAMKVEAVMMTVDSVVHRAVVHRVDRVDLLWKTSLMMRQEKCQFVDIATRVPRITIVAALVVDNIMIEEQAVFRGTLTTATVVSKGMTSLL